MRADSVCVVFDFVAIVVCVSLYAGTKNRFRRSLDEHDRNASGILFFFGGGYLFFMMDLHGVHL